MRAPLPGGYTLLARRGVRAFAWGPALGWLEEVLDRDGTLEAWALGAESAALAAGRGGARARTAPLLGPDGRARWACRHFRRGGRLAHIMRDRYAPWEHDRPIRELRAAHAARERGVRTPAVIAGAVYGSGVLRRADLVTELVPDAPPLAEVLFGEARADADRGQLLREVGWAVRGLEDARILHRDLSAGNVLLAGGGPAWVVDLDRCRVLPVETRPPIGPMRRRLERALRKLGARMGRPLAASEWEALRAGYEEPV